VNKNEKCQDPQRDFLTHTVDRRLSIQPPPVHLWAADLQTEPNLFHIRYLTCPQSTVIGIRPVSKQRLFIHAIYFSSAISLFPVDVHRCRRSDNVT